MSWIKLHRKIKDHWLYKSNDPMTKREAWVDILLTVNHSDNKLLIGDKLFLCKAGDSLLSLDSWSKRWRWNKSKVRRFLKLLEKDLMIELKSEQKTTRLTVCNWATYQHERNVNETQTKRKRNASETQVTPIEEGKEEINNDNNDKKIEAARPENKIKKFQKPTVENLTAYFEKIEISPVRAKIESENFMDHYDSNGWKIGGKSAMKDWKAAARNWKKRMKDFKIIRNDKRSTRIGPEPKRGQSFGSLKN